jgi:hypothetical protein
MKPLIILAVVLASATPVSARNVLEWQCGATKVVLSVKKDTPPYSYDVEFVGATPEELHEGKGGLHVNFLWLPGTPRSPGDIAYLNGIRCREIPQNTR